MNKHRISIFGSYGQRNVGDELLLRYSITYIREQYPDSVLCIMTRDIDHSKQFVNLDSHIEFINYIKHPFQAISQLFSSQSIYFGGGTLLKSLPPTVTSHASQSIIRVLVVCIIAKIMHKEIHSLGIGFGPFDNTLHHRLAQYALQLHTSIDFRDTFSYNEYRLGGSKQKISLSTDIMLKYKHEIINHATYHVQYEKPYELTINICHHMRSTKERENVIEYCASLIQKHHPQARILFIPMQDGFERYTDYHIGYELQQRFPQIEIATIRNLDDIISYIQQSKKLFVCRLHLGILCSILQANYQLYPYHPKITHWIQEGNQ